MLLVHHRLIEAARHLRSRGLSHGKLKLEFEFESNHAQSETDHAPLRGHLELRSTAFLATVAILTLSYLANTVCRLSWQRPDWQAHDIMMPVTEKGPTSTEYHTSSGSQ